ncbi:MAG: hypothetical protein ACK2TT_05035 [Anaerolineales bacterium]
MFNKRLNVALISGSVLGIFCILGGSVRLGWQGNQLLLFSLWYNRLLMGFVIGLAGGLVVVKGKLNWLFRGALLGLGVSAAYFLTAGAGDWVSFLAGVVYGVIIEYVLNRLDLR